MNASRKKFRFRLSPDTVLFTVAGVPIHRPVLLAAIFLFAFLLRAVYLFEYRASPLWDILTLDTSIHDLLARTISEQDFFGRHPFFRSPGYPYFLGFVYALFGPDLLVPRFIHILCGALSCVLIYLIGERVFRPAIGLVAALIAAIYWVFIYFEGELLLVAVYVFLLLLSLHLLLRSGGRRIKLLAAAGFVLGLATITRPNVLVFYPLALIWFFIEGDGRWKKRLARASLFFAPALLILFSVTLRNYVLGNDKVLIAYQAGVNFYIGNNHEAKGNAAETLYPVYKIPESYKWRHRDNLWINDDVWLSGYYLAEMDAGRELKPSEFQNYWFKRAFDDIASHKLDYVKLLLRKTYFFLNAYEVPSNKNPYRFIEENSRLLSLLSVLDFGMIVSLGLLGILVSLRKWRTVYLLYAFTFSYALTNIAFFINTRYRVPTIPFFILFAVFFLFWLTKALKKRQWLRAAASVLCGFSLLGFTHTEWFGLKDPMLESVLHYNLGTALAQKQRYRMAEKEFLESIRLHRAVAKPYESLCGTCNQAGEYDRAIAFALEGLALFPDAWKIRLHLGTAYLRKGEMEKAQSELECAVQAAPGDEVASLNLGIACFEMKDWEGAKKRFEKVLEIHTDKPVVHFVARLHLGILLLEQGDPAKAKSMLREAQKFAPSNPDVLVNLGKAHIQLGELQAAQEVLKRAIRAAPGLKEASALLESIEGR